MWLLIKSRLSFRACLPNLHLIADQGNTCPLYGARGKDCSHFLLHCPKINPLWHKVVALWEVNIIQPRSIITMFEYCFYSDIFARRIEEWWLTLYALFWFIWNSHNKIIFRQESFTKFVCFGLFIYYFSWSKKHLLRRFLP